MFAEKAGRVAQLFLPNIEKSAAPRFCAESRLTIFRTVNQKISVAAQAPPAVEPPGVSGDKPGAQRAKKEPRHLCRSSSCRPRTPAKVGRSRARVGPRTYIVAHMFAFVKALRRKKRSGPVKGCAAAWPDP